uniref:Uncharacterized protein n=1 Tax=Anguilla anguilla TaxID=7936 RepID=A0A0E9TMN0_ANGAN
MSMCVIVCVRGCVCV